MMYRLFKPFSDHVNCLQIDLDTIDVSNLNRQFLFQKKHVGKSKAEVRFCCLVKLRLGLAITV